MSDDLIRWMFSSAWRVVGAYLLLTAVGQCVAGIIKAFFPEPIRPEVHIYSLPLDLRGVNDATSIARVVSESLAKRPRASHIRH